MYRKQEHTQVFVKLKYNFVQCIKTSNVYILQTKIYLLNAHDRTVHIL